jgi:hypothetical protein
LKGIPNIEHNTYPLLIIWEENLSTSPLEATVLIEINHKYSNLYRNELITTL